MKLNGRKIFVLSVLIICIIAINLTVYFLITQKAPKEEQQKENLLDTSKLIEDFQNIFHNEVEQQGNIINVVKEDSTKELVYTSYQEAQTENTHYLNIHIPHFNINHPVAQAMNAEIDQLFYNKALDVKNHPEQYTNYHVVYEAYINDNILSLIIKATIKEKEDNPQRLIMKTYNYNLSTNSAVNLKQILAYRNVNESYLQNKINETIQLANQSANQYRKLGYSVYLRDVNNSMYQVNNAKFYFLGKDKALYILYPYGNTNYTSEMDLVVI